VNDLEDTARNIAEHANPGVGPMSATGLTRDLGYLAGVVDGLTQASLPVSNGHAAHDSIGIDPSAGDAGLVIIPDPDPIRIRLKDLLGSRDQIDYRPTLALLEEYAERQPVHGDGGLAHIRVMLQGTDVWDEDDTSAGMVARLIDQHRTAREVRVDATCAAETLVATLRGRGMTIQGDENLSTLASLARAAINDTARKIAEVKDILDD
jgi:hypothetical protein